MGIDVSRKADIDIGENQVYRFFTNNCLKRRRFRSDAKRPVIRDGGLRCKNDENRSSVVIVEVSFCAFLRRFKA